MHDRPDGRRAGASLAVVGLAALLVVSAGTATVDATATQESAEGEELTDGGLYFVGQQLVTDRYDAGTTLTLRRGDDSFVSDLVVDDDGVLRIDTARLEAGTYRLVPPDGPRTTFELARQTLRVSATPSRVSGADRTVQLTVDSNRDGYDLVVSVDGLDARTLADGSDQLTLRDGQAVLADAGTGETLTLDFDGVADGGYEVRVAVADTTATATTTVRVGASGGTATFGTSLVTEEVGDVARVPVEFDDVDRATLTVGSEALNWRVRVDVVDADGDGSAVVLVNTDNVRQAGRVFSATGADRVEDVRRLAGGRFDDPNRRIDPTSYPLRLSAGGATDAGSLTLENPNSVRQSVSATAVPGVLQATEVPDAVAGVGGDTTASVAAGDWVVLRVRAAGVFGYVDDVGDLTGEGSQGVTLRLVRQSGVGAGTDALGDGAGYVLVGRPAENTLFVFTKPDLGGLEVGDRYEARFRVEESNPYVGATVERSATVTVERPSVTVAATGDHVGVAATASGLVRGETNLADGTELAVSASGPGVTAAGEATVRDGRWSVDLDLSTAEPGERFTVEVGRPGETITSVDAVLTRPPSVAVANQTPSGDRLVTVDRVRLPNGGFVAVYDRPPGEDGRPAPLGTSTLLPRGTSRDVTVTLDEPIDGERSVVVVVHRNGGDGQFEFVTSDGARDRPYTADGRTVSAEVTLSTGGEPATTATTTETDTVTDTDTDTPTTDDTATDTPTDTDTDTPTTADTTGDDGDGGLVDGVGAPGFGPAAALVALFAVALLARRRR